MRKLLFEGRIEDASDGTEDGRLEINTVLSGTAVSRILINTTETVLNDNSKDLDFRVESDGNANMLFVNGGTNRVGIGTNAPDSALHVDNSHSGTLVTFHNTAGASSSDRGLDVETSTTGTTVQRWLNAGSELGRFTATGNLVVGSTVAPVGTGLVVNSKISSSSETAIEIQQATNGANKAAAAFGVAIANGGASTNAADLTFHTASGGSLGKRAQLTPNILRAEPGVNIGSTRAEVTISTTATTVLNMGALVTSGDLAKGRYLITVSRTAGTVGTAASSIFGLSSSGAIFVYQAINANSMTLTASGGNVQAASDSGSYAVHACAIPLSVDS